MVQVVMSTYHLIVKFPTEHRVKEVKVNQIVTRECYINCIKDQDQQKESFTINVSKTQPPRSDQKLKSWDKTRFLVIKEQMGQIVKIEGQLEKLTKTQLKVVLKENIDVMAYSANEILEVKLDIMVHQLNVRAECQPIKQKKTRSS